MEAVLEAEELEALRAVMGSVAAEPEAANPSPVEASRVALIAEDRAASQARPSGLRLVTRFARAARRVIHRLGAKSDLSITSVETVDAAGLRDELAASWMEAVAPRGRPGAILVSVSGPVIESLAARLLGSMAANPSDVERPPSAVAMSLFRPAGEAFVRALAEAWEEEYASPATPLADPAALSRVVAEITSGVALLATISLDGDVRGRIRVIARPETLLAPRAVADSVGTPAAVIEEILGAVLVELSVELGRARMTMSQLAALTPGSVVSLDRFIDDPLPVRCQGVVKAHGRAVVARNVMAVEITAASKE